MCYNLQEFAQSLYTIREEMIRYKMFFVGPDF